MAKFVDLDKLTNDINILYHFYFQEDLSDIDKKYCFIFKDKIMPDSLFKYTRIRHAEDLLVDDLLYVPTINELNDPYEGDILYNLEELHELYVNNFSTMLYDIDYSENISMDPKQFQKYIVSITRDDAKKIFDEGVDAFNNEVCVVCLSECNKINPMWSHYSEDHKGICIEYDLNDSDKIRMLTFPINYVDSADNNQVLRQILTRGLIKHRLLSEVYLKKSYDWHYEREWRIVIFKDDSNNTFNLVTSGDKTYIPFLKPKAVYLGLEIDDDDAEYVVDLCKLRQIPVYRMIKDNSNYNMDYSLYDD